MNRYIIIILYEETYNYPRYFLLVNSYFIDKSSNFTKILYKLIEVILSKQLKHLSNTNVNLYSSEFQIEEYTDKDFEIVRN